MHKAKEILIPHAKHWMPKPAREIDTKWGSNTSSCENILQGCYIVNKDGDNFWLLLFKEMSTHQGDWRSGWHETLTTMRMMPQM